MTINNNLNLNFEIASKNLQTLFKANDSDILDVNKKGEINTISKWNFIGRFIYKIKNYNNSVSKKIEQVLIVSLKTVDESIKDPRKNKFQVKHLSSFIVDMLYPQYYTYQEAANRILHKSFSDPVREAAEALSRNPSRKQPSRLSPHYRTSWWKD